MGLAVHYCLILCFSVLVLTATESIERFDRPGRFVFNLTEIPFFAASVNSSCNYNTTATTIFAADEDIQEGQLIVFLLLHRKLNVREDGVELFFEMSAPDPVHDDEGVIHIPSPKFRSVVSENQRLQPL
ncbi:hypothetical protein SprV_0401695500 [Sparganum proliferum]